MVTHVVVDGIGVCGAEGALDAAPQPALATCAICKAVLLYVGAPASTLLEDQWPAPGGAIRAGPERRPE